MQPLPERRRPGGDNFVLRAFLTGAGTLAGACCGVTLAAPWGLDAILVGVCVGSLLGAAFGVVALPVFQRVAAGLAAVADAIRPAVPPPPVVARGVVRLGAGVGALEGALVGAVHGGLAGGAVGTLLGVRLGPLFAMLAWRVRQDTPLFLLGLLAGVLIEGVGCLALGWLFREVARVPDMMVVLFAGLLLLLVLDGLLRVLTGPTTGPNARDASSKTDVAG